jgi:hypothetical protein
MASEIRDGISRQLLLFRDFDGAAATTTTTTTATAEMLEIQKQEISRQALISQHATKSVAWLNDVLSTERTIVGRSIDEADVEGWPGSWLSSLKQIRGEEKSVSEAQYWAVAQEEERIAYDIRGFIGKPRDGGPGCAGIMLFEFTKLIKTEPSQRLVAVLVVCFSYDR